MDQKKRVTLAALFVMTVLLAAGSIYITVRIQQNNAAADANASGFGSTATRDQYDNVAAAFDAQSCDKLIDRTQLGQILPGISYTFTTTEATTDTPKSCNYVFSNGVEASFVLYSYKSNSNVPDSAEELYDIVNSYSIIEQINTNTVSNTVSFYGLDYGNADYCRTNLFQTQNEFYYATMLYTKHTDTCDSAAMTNFDAGVFSTLASSIDKVIINVTKPNGRVQN